MKHYNSEHTTQAPKHGLTRKQKQAHKLARRNRRMARGKQWEVMA